MSDEQPDAHALVPVREQTVDFYGDQILAAQLADGTILVPIRPIVEALGVRWSGQFERLKRDPVLAAALRFVHVTRTNSTGGDPDVLALPLKLLPGFLFGLQASRVKPELRDKILRYQADCYEVLWTAFKGDILPNAQVEIIDVSPIEQALALAEAVASLARQQLEMEGRYTTMADYTRGFIQQNRAYQAQTNRRLDTAEDRLTALELRLSSGATISEAQAAEIAGAVKAVAMLLTAAGDANGFGRVWGELYRRFRVTSYHNLPAARYDEARAWLSTWYDELLRNTSQ